MEDAIQDAMFAFYGTTLEEIKIPTRKRTIAQKRQLYCYLCRCYTNMTFKEIGMVFNQDHSNIIHAIKTIKNLLQTDRKYRKEVLKIKNIIESKITTNLTKKDLTSNFFYF